MRQIREEAREEYPPCLRPNLEQFEHATIQNLFTYAKDALKEYNKPDEKRVPPAMLEVKNHRDRNDVAAWLSKYAKYLELEAACKKVKYAHTVLRRTLRARMAQAARDADIMKMQLTFHSNVFIGKAGMRVPPVQEVERLISVWKELLDDKGPNEYWDNESGWL